MKPYLEPRFIACLLLPAPSTGPAWSLAQRFETPCPLNRLHALEIQGMLPDYLQVSEAKQRDLAAEGLTRWRYYWVENGFDLERPDWEVALGDALGLQRRLGRQIADATAWLRVGLARASEETHSLGFEPRSREAARLLELKVLPENL